MIKEGEESYTTNLCQQCCNESLVARGDKPSTKWQWYEFVQKKGASWKVMEYDGKEQYIRELWAYFCRERLRENSCGHISAEEEQELKCFERMLRKKGKQECRASGSMNRQPGSTWSK